MELNRPEDETSQPSHMRFVSMVRPPDPNQNVCLLLSWRSRRGCDQNPLSHVLGADGKRQEEKQKREEVLVFEIMAVRR